MSSSPHEKSIARDNPFLRAAPAPRHAHRRGHNKVACPKTVSSAGLSAQAKWQKQSNRLKVKTGLIALVSGLFLLALMPASVQQRAFSLIGLGSAQQSSLSVPLPVDYDYVSSPFGPRWGRQHQGIDLAAQVGTPIYASSAGTVIHSGWEAGYGQSVVIDHGHGIKTRYGHCAKALIKAGKPVIKGQLIAQVGSTGHSTGPHLHFEVLVNGVRKNPAWYYKFDKVPHWYALKTTTGKNWLQTFSDRLAHWVKS